MVAFFGGGGGGCGVLVACTSLLGLVYRNILGRGGMAFNLLSSLRRWMVLELNFGVMHGMKGFGENFKEAKGGCKK